MLDDIRGQVTTIQAQLKTLGERLQQEKAPELPGLTLGRLVVFLDLVQTKLNAHDTRVAKGLMDLDRPLFDRAEGGGDGNSPGNSSGRRRKGRK